MADNIRRKCFKCGLTPKENSEIKLYRFPKPGATNILRCESWAKFCLPDKAWTCNEFQRKLHVEHRMLCNKHFRDTSFTDLAAKKLNRHAVPEVESNEATPNITANTEKCKDLKQICKLPNQMRNEKKLGLSYHRFPHPENNLDSFKAWVHIAGGKLDSPADYELYRKKVICDIHFIDRDRNRNNRLNFLAVPSLHLPGPNVLNESIVLAKERNYTSALSGKDKYPTTQSSGASTSVAPQPSTSKGPERVEVLRNEIDGKLLSDHTYLKSEIEENKFTVKIVKDETTFEGVPDSEIMKLTGEATEFIHDLPVDTEDLEMPEGCDVEIEYCTDDFPPPEPTYSWQKSDTIVLADDEPDTKAWDNDPNDVGDLSMYNDDVHQLPTSNQQKGENAVDTIIEEDQQTHFNYSCNLCKKSIIGFRYKCVQCANFDLCALCEAGGAHAHHYMLRIPKPTPYGEVEAVLDCIRKNLFEGKTDDGVAGASGDILDEIKTEAEDVVLDEAVQDEIMPLPSIMDQIVEEEDVVDPLVWETETRASTAQFDYSSDSDISAVRTEPPVLRKRKRKNSDDPLRIDSVASNRDEEDEVTTSRVKTPHSIPEDIFNLHLQLEETPDETPLAKKPALSTPASKTYVVITKEQHQKMLKLSNLKVNVNRLTREDINAVLQKTSKS